MDEKIFLVALHSLWFTHKKLYEIFKNKQNYKNLYENITKDKLKTYKLQDKQIDAILSKKEKIDLNKLGHKLQERFVKIITIFDKQYPEQLKKIQNYTFLIYIRWELPEEKYFSVVWSRKISNYWEKVIENLIPDLIKYFTIVSWWAFWCDSKAHKETLKSWWKTIAVLWTWIDIDYPIQNEKMYNEIVKTWWAILSIFPIWTPWSNYSFPIRNEIVAGLSTGILVIEAQEKSWSLITSKLALDLGKDLFAIPWDIFNLNSVWTNNLISNGEAKLVNKSFDILSEYWLTSSNIIKNEIKFNDNIEKDIYNSIQNNPLTVDELSKALNLELKILNLKLSFMELSWIIHKINSWKYCI